MNPKLAKGLEKLTARNHGCEITVFESGDTIDVVAIKDCPDPFPLPFELQEALLEVAQECALHPAWLHASTAQIVSPEQWPEDFFADRKHEEGIFLLGRSGEKYLHLFTAIHRELDESVKTLIEMELSERERFQALQWLRKEGLLENRHRERLATVLEMIS